MATRKQVEANRKNAKRSTGPRSKAGKARSRHNARKHGLTAATLVIGGENPSEFEELRAELIHEHDPQSTLEYELVERLTGILWRLRRIPFFEAAILDARQAQLNESTSNETMSWGPTYRQMPEKDQEDEEHTETEEEMSDEEWSVRVGDALIQDGAFGDGLGKLARHEATLMNAFTRTLQMLFLLKANHSKKSTLILETKALPPKG
jgi:hypothetical protein